MERLKQAKALIRIFPFQFELTYLLGGNLVKISFDLYLYPPQREIYLEKAILKKPALDFLKQLKAYFHGKLSYLDLPHSLECSDFTRRVLKFLREIPRGKTLTYKELAGMLNYPGAERAVAKALSSNPLPLLYPCHRIISKRGLGGFSQGQLLKWLLLFWESPNKDFDILK